jgi:hypothetical protein
VVFVAANEMRPLCLQEVINFVYGKIGIGNKLRVNSWGGELFSWGGGVVDELLGATWTSAMRRDGFSSCNMQLCFIRYVL